jgi:hypothetical protein
MERNVWRKSSASNNNGSCVEVMIKDTAVLVRDTKDNGAGFVHTYTHAEWLAFLDGARKGEFDL